MARTLPDFGDELVKEIETAWVQPQAGWARRRLLVVRLIAQHELTSEQIAKVADVSRKTVFNYRDTVVREGVAGLLKRDWAGARLPVVRGPVADEFVQRLEAGQFRQAKDAQAWIKKRTRKKISESGALKVLRRLGGKLKMPRKSHAKKDPAKARAFKAELPGQTDRGRGHRVDQTGAHLGPREALINSMQLETEKIKASYGQIFSCTQPVCRENWSLRD